MSFEHFVRDQPIPTLLNLADLNTLFPASSHAGFYESPIRSLQVWMEIKFLGSPELFDVRSMAYPDQASFCAVHRVSQALSAHFLHHCVTFEVPYYGVKNLRKTPTFLFLQKLALLSPPKGAWEFVGFSEGLNEFLYHQLQYYVIVSLQLDPTEHEDELTKYRDFMRNSNVLGFYVEDWLGTDLYHELMHPSTSESD